MYDRHREKRIDIGLRLGGAMLGGASSLALRKLASLHLSGPHPDPSIGALLLAVAAFLCASLGSILLTQGRHIFDPIELGERWRTRLPYDTGGSH
jgi:hypothetical protein